jgi:hypothetical protein
MSDYSKYDHVISAFHRGDVIPFLGAGVNLFGRDEEDDYTPGIHLPSGRELASYLAREFLYSMSDQKDLLRVSQYAATVSGPAPLYNRLGEVFDAEYPITELHRFFARLPSVLERRGSKRPHQLIITTNYDDVLEEALREAKEPFDVVTYVAKAPHQGKFRHIPHGSLPRDGASLIRPGEFKDANGLAVRLRDGADAASLYLRERFAPDAQKALEAYDGSAPAQEAISQILVAELNRLLRESLFDTESFECVTLSEEAKKLIGSKPQAHDLIRINRFLLEETYPHEVAHSPKSYINIDNPNEYYGLPFDNLKPKRTIVLKIHGAVDRVADRGNLPPEVMDVIDDSFVITEDDYINYLARTDISKLVPIQLKTKFSNSGFLFLGYGLRDWNLRVIMHRMWGEQELGYASWAIQLSAQEMDKKLWLKRNVNIIEMRLEDYIRELEQRLGPDKGGGA